MSSTGRIKKSLPPCLRDILFGNTADAVEQDIPMIADIDRAHILMLVRTGLMKTADARALLDTINRAESGGFHDLLGKEANRGTYLLWENHLIQILGDRIGGSVHLARSRNDMHATMMRMRLRDQHLRLVRETIRLNRCLMQKANNGLHMMSVGYTQFRPAMPLTVGHQMGAWSTALCRDIRGLIDAGHDLGRCPMGAGALGGTSLPIDPSFVSDLLGFREPATNSLDAVASRDVALRILAAATVLAVTMSRFATDLQHWALDEVGFITFPDELVGSSSQMPQKRNPYLLEHVASRAMSAAGAFVTASTRMHATPFSNSVAVGTEAIRGIGEALRDVHDTACILRHVIAGAEFRAEEISKVADSTFINATALANRLVLDCGLSFREAHHAVGEMVTQATHEGMSLADVAQRESTCGTAELTPTEIAFAGVHGGGPGINSVVKQLEVLRNTHEEFCRYFRDEQAKIKNARTKLHDLSRSLGREQSYSGCCSNRDS